MIKSNERTFSFLQKCVDLIVVGFCWLVAYLIRFELMPNAQEGLEFLFLKIYPVIALLTFFYYQQNGLYRSLRFNSRYKEIFAVLKSNSLAILTLVIFLYFFAQDRLSRVVLAYYWFFSTFLLITTRMMVRNFLRALRRRGKNVRFAVLVGDGPQMQSYMDTLLSFKDAGISVAGWIDGGEYCEKFSIAPYSKSIDEAKSEFSPDFLVLGYAGSESFKSEAILKKHYNDLISIQVVPDLSYSFIGAQVEDFGGVPILNVNKPHINSWETYAKRAIDMASCGLGLILISPLLLLIAFLVKLSSRGPVFYGQERVGIDGQNFTMWKFRTMKLAETDEDLSTWTTKDDPRKTKFGSFLRKTSLDELPQVWNVFIGNMSLVGPRPERPYFVEKFKEEIPGYMLRHKMKAGITGWAQVNGWRGDTSIQKRIEFDFYYIKNWSIWFDLRILFLTFWKGFINKNAY